MFDKQKKDKQLQIRLTEQQKSFINELAKKNNMNVSEFLLMLVQRYVDNCK